MFIDDEEDIGEEYFLQLKNTYLTSPYNKEPNQRYIRNNYINLDKVDGKYSADTWNDIYQHCVKYLPWKIIRTKSGGICKDKSKVFSSLHFSYDVQKKTNRYILTILTPWLQASFTTGRIEDDSFIYGPMAEKLFWGICNCFGIDKEDPKYFDDSDDFAIMSRVERGYFISGKESDYFKRASKEIQNEVIDKFGLEWKKMVESPLSLYNTNYSKILFKSEKAPEKKDKKTLYNCKVFHIDGRTMWLGCLCKVWPEFYAPTRFLYNCRKKMSSDTAANATVIINEGMRLGLSEENCYKISKILNDYILTWHLTNDEAQMLMKKIPNLALGNMMSAGATHGGKYYKLVANAKNTANEIVRKLKEQLIELGYDWLIVNTDGIWISEDKENPVGLSFEELSKKLINFGDDVGTFRFDEFADIFYYEGSKKYYFIEPDGKVNSVLSGKCQFDFVKPDRSTWTLKEFQNIKDILDVEFDDIKGLTIEYKNPEEWI